MWRLTERMVRSTLVTAWRLATSPTSTSPPFANATTEGVVRAPSALGMTVGSPPSSTATTEFVVPRSIPTARAICVSSTVCCYLSLLRSSLGLERPALNYAPDLHGDQVHVERTRLNPGGTGGIPERSALTGASRGRPACAL